MRSVRLLSILLASALAFSAPALASARAVRPLTSAEYHQLHHAQDRIRSLESSDGRSFRRASAVCTHLDEVTRLITAVRNGCVDLIRLGGDDAKLNAQATKCGIDPPSEAAILTCLVPAVQSYYQDAEAFYRAESYVDRLARARGFSSSCVAVIGDSPRNIAAEGRLAGDLKAAVQALKNQNPEALQTLSQQIDTAVKSIKPGPSSLSLCPRRPASG
ncbi:MAG TPA: hypothetical protein VG293_09645 [Solirubrobacteraceae bacterium]|jgi:hypothetical protein|nr:hypothetical protein [Solirubrobacteraceae bacterium]